MCGCLCKHTLISCCLSLTVETLLLTDTRGINIVYPLEGVHVLVIPHPARALSLCYSVTWVVHHLPHNFWGEHYENILAMKILRKYTWVFRLLSVRMKVRKAVATGSYLWKNLHLVVKSLMKIPFHFSFGSVPVDIVTIYFGNMWKKTWFGEGFLSCLYSFLSVMFWNSYVLSQFKLTSVLFVKWQFLTYFNYTYL